MLDGLIDGVVNVVKVYSTQYTEKWRPHGDPVAFIRCEVRHGAEPRDHGPIVTMGRRCPMIAACKASNVVVEEACSFFAPSSLGLAAGRRPTRSSAGAVRHSESTFPREG